MKYTIYAVQTSHNGFIEHITTNTDKQATKELFDKLASTCHLEQIPDGIEEDYASDGITEYRLISFEVDI